NLWEFGIHPDHRGKGYAKFLLKKMLYGLAEANFETASLNVDLTNEPAYNLYKKYGFKDDWIKIAYVLTKEK
ncbi:MAG: GNAT family N-acetyltransferase, partial [Candidatus Heimdallarchaeota archaeon]